MKRPFFSIIIPTKNRSFLISKAIESVLIQDFNDFELIIVDNDDENNTKKVIETYNDQRIRYFRTGGFGMVDNWEFAYSKASGDYITVLTDRMYYISKIVLQTIYDAIKSSPLNVVTWRWTSKDESVDKIIDISQNSSHITLKTKDVLHGFLEGGDKRHWFNLTSPKGLNSCVSRSLYLHLIDKYGRLFYPIAPDFTAAFILLFNQEELLHINDGLVVSGGSHVSNGINAVKDKKRLISYINDLEIELMKAYSYTPIKVLSVFNSMYNDLFFVSHMLNWDLNWDMVNKVEYYLLIHSEIISNKYQKDKKSDLQKWRIALKKEDYDIQKAVSQRLSDVKRNKTISLLTNKIKLVYKYKIAPLLKSSS